MQLLTQGQSHVQLAQILFGDGGSLLGILIPGGGGVSPQLLADEVVSVGHLGIAHIEHDVAAVGSFNNAGVGFLTITDRHMEQFITLLLDYYNTGESEQLKDFLYENTIQGIA